jgi:hypothetical protein
MTDGAKGTPIVRRRYGAVKQVRSGERKSGEIKGCYRYHAYTLLECTTASDGQVVVEELREVTLFHVMPKRVERGRPSKEESQQPEDMWSKYNPAWCTNARKELNEHNVNAHGGIKTEQNAQNVTPTNATPPRSIGRSTSGATFEPPRSQSAYVTLTDEGAVVKSGAAPLVVRAPPVEIETEHGQGPGCLVQFTSENSGENLVIGAITTSMDGRGVALHSAAGDIAEWHPLRESTASSTLQAGEIVGIHAAGRICRATAAANQCGIISRRPMLVGSMPADPAAAGGVVAYTGQVPIRVRGAVKAGDPLVPTGDGDGVAVALSTFALEHPAATRVAIVGIALDDAAAGRVGEERTNLANDLVMVSVVPPSLGWLIGSLAISAGPPQPRQPQVSDGDVMDLLRRMERVEVLAAATAATAVAATGNSTEMDGLPLIAKAVRDVYCRFRTDPSEDDTNGLGAWAMRRSRQIGSPRKDSKAGHGRDSASAPAVGTTEYLTRRTTEWQRTMIGKFRPTRPTASWLVQYDRIHRRQLAAHFNGGEEFAGLMRAED